MEYYIEYIFAENFVIDFILLYITGNLLKKKIIYKRLLASSAIGALYVILVVTINRGFLNSFIVKLSISVLMLMVSYDSKGIITNIRLVICFYIVSLLMVGLISALYYLAFNKATVNVIIVSMFLGFALLKFFFTEIKSKRKRADYMRSIIIDINNKTKTLNAYIDTGNDLTDPLTGKPVVVVNLESIRELLGEDISKEIMEFYNSSDKSYVNLFLEKNYDLRLRVIKYNTISNKGELMVCVIPDSLTILGNDKNIMKAEALIGINPQKINDKGDYEALLFKKLLDWESETNYENVC